MPETSEKLWQSLGADKSIGEISIQKITEAGIWGQLPKGTKVSKGSPLFSRLETVE